MKWSGTFIWEGMWTKMNSRIRSPGKIGHVPGIIGVVAYMDVLADHR